jgi:glycosyltransferase involved in cell wall biosynthesis
MPDRVSVLIPARNERFVSRTVQDLLEKAAGDVEVIVTLDGQWADPPLPVDPRVITIYRGQSLGMRAAINSAAAVATGKFLMKIDGHCLVSQDWDRILKADCDDDWIVVPRRFSLDPESWCIANTGKAAVDYHFLDFPTPGEIEPGWHGQVWRERARERLHLEVDDEMSSQGSCWFTTRHHFTERLGYMSEVGYGRFSQEFQELGMKTWLGGGRCIINKRAFYAHLHKGKTYGRGYYLSKDEHVRGIAYSTDYWFHDRWPAKVRDLAWLIDKFWPVPTWPANWQALRGQITTSTQRSAVMGTPKNGPLVIVSAKYGLSETEGQFVDVTEAVKGFVKEDRLELKVRNDDLKVGNPFAGQRKRLMVSYTIGGVAGSISTIERKTALIPPAAPSSTPAPAEADEKKKR